MPTTVWRDSEMIMKVKEPIKVEWPRMRKGQLIFTYFHFAADEELTQRAPRQRRDLRRVRDGGAADARAAAADADVGGRRAGWRCRRARSTSRSSTAAAACCSAACPGVAPAKVVILGGGIVGINAAKMAAGMGAKVVILDISLERLRYLSDVMPANVQLIYSNRHNILEQITTADLVVGGVLIPGAKAPKLVRREDLKPHAARAR